MIPTTGLVSTKNTYYIKSYRILIFRITCNVITLYTWIGGDTE